MASVARAPPVAVTPRRRVACAGTRARDSSDAVGAVARRACLLLAPSVAASLGRRAARADEASVKIVRDVAGFGAKEATSKSLVLVEYEGTLASDGAVFDTTLGGRVYATSSSGVGSVSIAPAAARPVVVNLRSDAPVPGVPEGLRLGIRGMRVGGTRTFEVPSELGFGSSGGAVAVRDDSREQRVEIRSDAVASQRHRTGRVVRRHLAMRCRRRVADERRVRERRAHGIARANRAEL